MKNKTEKLMIMMSNKMFYNDVGDDEKHTASKLTIVSKFYHIVRKKCDNFRVRYK